MVKTKKKYVQSQYSKLKNEIIDKILVLEDRLFPIIYVICRLLETLFYVAVIYHICDFMYKIYIGNPEAYCSTVHREYWIKLGGCLIAMFRYRPILFCDTALWLLVAYLYTTIVEYTIQVIGLILTTVPDYV